MPDIGRSRRLRALSLGDRAILSRGLDSLGELGAVELLKGPETGLVMVRGRVGGSGAPFNLGELMVTSCAVKTSGFVGYGFSQGDDPEGSFLAALGDALAQDPERGRFFETLILELERDLQNKDEALAAKTEKTRVEFLTLARGEDDD